MRNVALFTISMWMLSMSVMTVQGKALVNTDTSSQTFFPLYKNSFNKATTNLLAKKLNFTQLKMINDINGWAFANHSLWITQNGGTSWRNVSPSLFPRNGHILYQFLNAKTAWVIVEPPFTYPKKPLPSMLYITTDGGVKWVEKKLTADQPIYYPDHLELVSKNLAWLTAYTHFPDTMQTPPMKIFKWGHGKFNEVTSLSSDSHWKWMHFFNDQVGLELSNFV